MQDKVQGMESTPPLTERRACPRIRVTSLIYIDIGKVNGGIVTSLSETGLALMAAATLKSAQWGDGPLPLRIQFPGVPEALEASGEIVWTSSSRKEARVRFVEISEKARDQIRRLISDQISSDGPPQGLPELPKMQLPNSQRAKERARRFSFSDVASSRVDAEGEAGLEGFAEIGGEPGDFPPLHVGSSSFGDGAEVVASAFESPAFAERQTKRPFSAEREQRTESKPDSQPQRQPSPSIPERRQHPRREILLFTYAVLGDDNGGLAFNLGEGGFALTAAATLQEHHFAKIRVRFPDSEDWIETSGQLAWKNDSGKEAGIEFAGLPEDVRAKIREWVSQGESALDLRSNEDGSQTSQSGVQESPHFMETEESPAEPFEIPTSSQEQPFEERAFDYRKERARTPAPSSSALFKSGIKGILERASVGRRVARIKPPQPAKYSATPRNRVSSKALSIAAGVALAVGGWMFFQRTSFNKPSGVIAQNVPNLSPAPESLPNTGVAKTEAGAVGATADLPVPLSDNTSQNIATQTPILTQKATAAPTVQQIERESPPPDASKIPEPVPNSDVERASKGKPRKEDALVHKAPATSASRSSDQAQRTALSQHAQEAELTKTTVSVRGSSSENKLVENKAAESKPVQIAQARPVLNSNASNPNKDPNLAPPTLNANLPQPAAAPPVGLEKEKQPAPPLARTPVVSVSFDPFPSIRMPKAEKSKKSQQGKSLQMGRLVSRVDPVYPEQARQQGVEGTARVHAIFNRDGSVQSVISLSGPQTLVAAATKAVQQWRYSQTILGGQPMETEEDVTVQFRLASSGAKN